MEWWGILLCVLGVCAALFLLFSFLAFRMAFASPLKGQNDETRGYESESARPYKELLRDAMQDLVRRPYERVGIRAYDSLQLSGRWYEQDPDKPVVVAFHGYRSLSVRDFCLGARFYLDRGFTLLLPDQRAHGCSKGRFLTMGVKEKYDCLYWARYAAQRCGKDRPVILAGISMGAATVLMASDLPLPENVVCIVADCPYASPKEIVKDVMRSMRLPAKLFYPFLYTGARLFGGFDLSSHGAADAVKNAKVPVLLIHGQEDHFVPYRHSEKIHKANPDLVEFHGFPGAAHGLSYVCDPQRYESILRDFLSRALNTGNSLRIEW